MSPEWRRNDLLGVIALLILLIGIATGNAFTLLGLSVVALVVSVIFYPKLMGSGPILVALVAAVLAAVISNAM